MEQKFKKFGSMIGRVVTWSVLDRRVTATVKMALEGGGRDKRGRPIWVTHVVDMSIDGRSWGVDHEYELTTDQKFAFSVAREQIMEAIGTMAREWADGPMGAKGNTWAPLEDLEGVPR